MIVHSLWAAVVFSLVWVFHLNILCTLFSPLCRAFIIHFFCVSILDSVVAECGGRERAFLSLTKPLTRKRMLLELVHTDVCYVDSKSHAGSQYFVTFIDVCSWKLWVVVLKTKDQVLSVFKEFQESRERNRSKIEGSPSRQWRQIPREIWGVLPIEGNPARIHCAKDARAKRDGREDEPDHHGKGLMC